LAGFLFKDLEEQNQHEADNQPNSQILGKGIQLSFSFA
jgi:hypothetical protein